LCVYGGIMDKNAPWERIFVFPYRKRCQSCVSSAATMLGVLAVVPFHGPASLQIPGGQPAQ
jgi:hypothetical protein